MKYRKINLITISPTFDCNFNCAHCGIKKSGKFRSISISSAKKFLEIAKNNKIKKLEISGGEPLLNFKKTLKIIELAKKMGFYIILDTNGYYIASPNPEKTIEKLKDVNHIALSVDHSHLKFISYSKILNVIKTILKNNIKISINMTNYKGISQKNFKLLKKLSKNLHGRLFTISPLNFSNVNLRYYYNSFNFCVIFGKKTIPVAIFNAVKTDSNKNKINIRSMKLEHILFTPCMNFEPLIDYNSNIYPCCSMQALNNKRFCSIGKIDGNDENIFDIKNPIFKEILNATFPFLKIFLMIKKDGRLMKDFLKKKYGIPCDFCLEIQKHKKYIQRLEQPSTKEMLIFTIFNFHHFINNISRIVMWKLIFLTGKFILIISRL